MNLLLVYILEWIFESGSLTTLQKLGVNMNYPVQDRYINGYIKSKVDKMCCKNLQLLYITQPWIQMVKCLPYFRQDFFWTKLIKYARQKSTSNQFGSKFPPLPQYGPDIPSMADFTGTVRNYCKLVLSMISKSIIEIENDSQNNIIENLEHYNFHCI